MTVTAHQRCQTVGALRPDVHGSQDVLHKVPVQTVRCLSKVDLIAPFENRISNDIQRVAEIRTIRTDEILLSEEVRAASLVEDVLRLVAVGFSSVMKTCDD